MQTKKVYLAVSVTADHMGNTAALSSALFAREELVKQNIMVRVQCVQDWDVLAADVEKVRPDMVLIVEGREGKQDLEVFHQVLPDWNRYERSYMAAKGIIFHSRRLRKMHNRYVQAGYMMQWMQRIQAPAVYVRLGIEDEIKMDEMLSQGKAFMLGVMQYNAG